MQDLDLRPMFPDSLVMTGENQTLRRRRETHGDYRNWIILPRYGTAESDRWTMLGQPRPGDGNPASEFEDGQFPSLADARSALDAAESVDDGTHQD